MIYEQTYTGEEIEVGTMGRKINNKHGFASQRMIDVENRFVTDYN